MNFGNKFCAMEKPLSQEKLGEAQILGLEVLYTAWNVGSFSSQVISFPSLVYNPWHILFSVCGIVKAVFLFPLCSELSSSTYRHGV